MDGQFVPDGAYAHPSGWLAPFEDVTTVQFNHRIMAYILSASVIALVVAGCRRRPDTRATAVALVLALVLQVLLGIWTLLAVVPLSLAAMHQFGSVVLLTAALLHLAMLNRQAATQLP
jgi:cytochrome c oxidase assembly protein subunit 15